MKVEILKKVKGSENGIDVREFRKGEIVTINETLADVFLNRGWACEHKEPELKFDPVKEKPATEKKSKKVRKKK